MPKPDKYSAVRKFLSRHTDIIELQAGRAAVIIAANWQGRIMSATADGQTGACHGWVNRPYIESGRHDVAFNNYGGLERLWIGPEVGPYSFWFIPRQKQNISNWTTPRPLNDGTYKIVRQDATQVVMKTTMAMTNYAGIKFRMKVDRTVRLLTHQETCDDLGMSLPPGVQAVTVESQNRLTNAGKHSWKKATGLPSLWTIGQFNAGAKVCAIFPMNLACADSFGKSVSDDYYGKLSSKRLRKLGQCAVMTCDGVYRSKIGVPAAFSKDTIASYNKASNALVLVRYSLPAGAAALPYVNSRWRRAGSPYQGDVVNCYNDGPLVGNGKQGTFYELETSSQAAELSTGESISHISRTCILQGDKKSLRPLAWRHLGVDILGL